MADLMSEAWLAFARTGNPDTGHLPHWPPYSLDERNVMLFDLPPAVQSDPHQAERLAMARYPTQQLGRTLHR
jgi:para-nitrobenzyl esterase